MPEDGSQGLEALDPRGPFRRVPLLLATVNNRILSRPMKRAFGVASAAVLLAVAGCAGTTPVGGDDTERTGTPYAGCPTDAETWRGLRICSERPREGYDRDDYGTGYRSLEDDIIAALPATMKADGQVYTPYSCIAFDITSDGTAATDIEHIVALAEAHDSGIADDQRRAIASDLDNLTIADPTVNRSQKSARDAAEWVPTHGLTVDPAERDALEALLAGGGALLNCVN